MCVHMYVCTYICTYIRTYLASQLEVGAKAIEPGTWMVFLCMHKQITYVVEVEYLCTFRVQGQPQRKKSRHHSLLRIYIQVYKSIPIDHMLYSSFWSLLFLGNWDPL